MAKILAYATGSITPGGEENVALEAADIKKIGIQVVTGDTNLKDPDGNGDVWALSSYVVGTYRYVRDINGKVDALTAKVAELSAKVDGLSR
jgi:hypothetical protein